MLYRDDRHHILARSRLSNSFTGEILLFIVVLIRLPEKFCLSYKGKDSVKNGDFSTNLNEGKCTTFNMKRPSFFPLESLKVKKNSALQFSLWAAFSVTSVRSIHMCLSCHSY